MARLSYFCISHFVIGCLIFRNKHFLGKGITVLTTSSSFLFSKCNKTLITTLQGFDPIVTFYVRVKYPFEFIPLNNIFVSLNRLTQFIAEFHEHCENDRFDSFVHTHKQYSNFFQSNAHQTNKEIKNKADMSTKVLSN